MTQDWIPVGALGDAFAPDNNCLPPVGDLAGQSLTLHFENGWIIRHQFQSANELSWTLQQGDGEPTRDDETYIATRPRAGIYFVDFIKRSTGTSSVSLVLDIENGVFLATIGQLPTSEDSARAMLARIEQKLELTAVKCTFLRGTIDAEFSGNAPTPAPTRELIGKRIEYRYNKAENYEHIYLNDNFYTWHCLEGSERGLCDSDACHYYKIREDLYLFVWREKIVPTLGVICIDLRSMKTTGKIFGYEENDFATTRNFSVGAYAKLISIVTRQDVAA